MTERLAVRRSRVAATAFVVGLLILCATVGAAIYVRGAAYEHNCEAINEDRVILQRILHRFEAGASAEGAVIFERSIRELAPREC